MCECLTDLWFFFCHFLPWMHETGCKNNGLTTWMFAYDDVMISRSRPCLHEIVSDGCFSRRIPLQGDTARHQIRAWQWHSPSVINCTRRSQGSMCFPQRDPGKGRSIGGRQELPDVSKSSAERKKTGGGCKRAAAIICTRQIDFSLPR